MSVKLKSIAGVGRTGHPGGSLEGESGSRGAAGSRPEEGGGLGRLTRLCWLHVGVPSDLGTCTVAEKSGEECLSHQAAGLSLSCRLGGE